uniref:Organic cation/carnitine transporter 3-like n=1 Tax=Nicotiana tabacum TaxID=4097 RepID=A0A1S3XEG0_TOBAC
MAEKTEPFLSNDKKLKRKLGSSLDETIETCIGEFGWTQFLQAIFVSIAWFFDAQQTFISVFTDAQPSWHCISCNSSSSSSIDNNFCNLPKDAWTWDLPSHISVVSEWSLQCRGSVIAGLPASSFFMGCLIGGFLLSTLADSSLGRKNMLVLSCLLMSITGSITAFSTNIWMYSFLRFLSGFGRATIGTCALVLSTELVGRRWRDQVGIIGFHCFTMGFISLPTLAFINRGSTWRILYLWTCLPTILYSFLVYFIVPESPRWLYIKGNKEGFVQTLKSIAPPTTRSSLTLSFFGSFIEFENQEVLDNNTVDLYSAIRMLVERNWSFRRLVTVMCVGFGIGMTYYGMPLGVGSLNFNLYLSITLNALSELPSSILILFLIGKLSRKSSLLGFAILSGICSIGCVIFEGGKFKELQIGVELISYFSACTAFSILLIYTLELFPTCVRNSAVAMVRQAMVLGGAFSPMLIAIGRNNKWYCFGVFGLSIVIC